MSMFSRMELYFNRPSFRRKMTVVLGHDNLLCDIIEGKIWGKATRGRKRMKLLHDMMEGRFWTVERGLRGPVRKPSRTWSCESPSTLRNIFPSIMSPSKLF